MLIDELIQIDLNLASVAQLPLIHRKFAMLANLTTSDEYMVITKSSLETDLKKIDKANNTKVSSSSLIRTWFENGGIELTIINAKKDIEKLTKIEPKNIILVGLPTAEQLTIYNKLAADVKANKNIFFSIELNTKLENYPKGRNTFFYLDGNPHSFFAYFAPYSQAKYYTSNNYKTSSFQGVKLESLDYVLLNNIGALVYFPEFKESKYINIKDSAGFNYNLDVLKDDLQADIKANLLTALSSNNLYNQSNILRLENVMAMTADKYVEINLISSFKTASLPLDRQTPADIKNNILRGLMIRYKVETEIEQVKVTIQEEV